MSHLKPQTRKNHFGRPKYREVVMFRKSIVIQFTTQIRRVRVNSSIQNLAGVASRSFNYKWITWYRTLKAEPMERQISGFFAELTTDLLGRRVEVQRRLHNHLKIGFRPPRFAP